MTFLPQYSQMMLIQLELSEFQNRRQVVQCDENAITREMYRYQIEYSEMSPGDEDVDITDQPYYKWLEQQTNLHEQQATALDQQIQVLETQLNTLKTQTSNNIKLSCGSQLGGQ